MLYLAAFVVHVILFMALTLCIIVPVWYAYRRSVSRDGIEVNHVTLFTFGFLFYWVLPIAVGQLFTAFSSSVPANWAYFLGRSRVTSEYLIVSLASYVAFAGGDTVASLLLRQKLPHTRPLNSTALWIWLTVASLLFLYVLISLRSLLFQGYNDRDAAGWQARGTMTACVVLLGIIALLHYSHHSQNSIRNLITSPFVAPFVAASVLLLCLGSRLYVMSLFLMFIAYRSSFVGRLPTRKLVLGALALAALSGTIGAIRSGSAMGVDSPFLATGENIMLEPIFASLSLVYFLSYDAIAWVNVPEYLLSDFIALIPRAMLPGKDELIQFPYVYSPVGALHSFVSFNVNFGIIGTVVFMFLLSLLLCWLRIGCTSQLSRVSYVMLSGWLAFSFFRDPFSISLVKLMLENSLMIPAIIVGFNRMVQVLGTNQAREVA